MRNYKTTIAGSFAALGTFLAGAPVAFAVCNVNFIPLNVSRVFVIVGFAMSGLGIFFGHLFSADSGQVELIKKDVKELQNGTANINKSDITNR